MGESPEPPVDAVNRSTWTAFVEEFAIEGWGDPGELAALLLVADRARGASILDLGVGGGRTYPLLRLLSADYVGIDYLPAMVELCRQRHPDADVRLGDARQLSGIPDASRDLVVYSSNGIDAVDHEDRQRVLAAVHRVLRPGGLFLFSTLNKAGPLFAAPPGSAPETPWVPGSLLPRPTDEVTGDVAGSGDNPRWLEAVRNWRRLRAMIVDAGDWGMAPFAPHNYGLVTHFVTLSGARAELDAGGFDVTAVVACDATTQLADGEQTDAMYFHVVAQRRD